MCRIGGTSIKGGKSGTSGNEEVRDTHAHTHRHTQGNLGPEFKRLFSVLTCANLTYVAKSSCVPIGLTEHTDRGLQRQ